MTFRTLLLASSFSLFGAIPAAFAVDQALINQVTQDFVDQGYMYIEVKTTMNGFKIEATGDAGTIERVYDANGTILREEFGSDTDYAARIRAHRSGDDDGATHDIGDDHGRGGDDDGRGRGRGRGRGGDDSGDRSQAHDDGDDRRGRGRDDDDGNDDHGGRRGGDRDRDDD